MTGGRLLATDLDGTFIGDDRAMLDLWNDLRAGDVIVAFSTGRHLGSVCDFYEQKNFPGRAEVCICMVGTDICFREGDTYLLDREWHGIIRQGWDKAAVEDILRTIPGADMQDPQWQSPFKSSYYLEEKAKQRLADIRRRLDDAGVHAKVVYSAGRYLDLLPAKSGKGEAVRFVAGKLNVPAANVVTCGDTGNDLDMMRGELGFRCIAVGNAAPELKAFTEPHVYHAEAHFAAGLREGLEAFGWL